MDPADSLLAAYILEPRSVPSTLCAVRSTVANLIPMSFAAGRFFFFGSDGRTQHLELRPSAGLTMDDERGEAVAQLMAIASIEAVAAQQLLQARSRRSAPLLCELQITAAAPCLWSRPQTTTWRRLSTSTSHRAGSTAEAGRRMRGQSRTTLPPTRWRGSCKRRRDQGGAAAAPCPSLQARLLHRGTNLLTAFPFLETRSENVRAADEIRTERLYAEHPLMPMQMCATPL